jgi:hypothetical protein
MRGRPRYRACWSCSRKLHGNHHATVQTHGGEVIVHVACGERMERDGDGWAVRR